MDQQAPPLKSRLRVRGMQVVGGCYLYGGHEENTKHLFFECAYTKNAHAEVVL